MEEQKKDLGELLNEAGDEFAKQFDPQSENYHKGSQVPVSLGGKNIPVGMSTEYDPNYEEYKKNLDQQENSPEYQKLSGIRDHFVQLKNFLNKLCVPYEAILRHTDTFKTKGNPNNQKHVDSFNKNIAIEKQKLEEIIVKLKESQQFVNQLKNPEYEKIEEQLKLVLKDVSTQEFQTKEQLAEYQFLAKKVSQLVFAEANKLLQEMKKVKGIEIKKK